MMAGALLVIIFLLFFLSYFWFLNRNFHEMTIKIFLMKIFRKIFKFFFKKNPFKFPIGERSSYFAKVNESDFSKSANTIILNIPTSDNFREAVHPEVIYIDKGFGSNKHKFWMVCTPYPNQDDRYENPEIFSSEDGFFWHSPQSGVNPIIKKPSIFLSHNSDVSMVYHQNKLTVFFRTSFYEGSKKSRNLIQSIESQDGVNWINLKTLMDSDKNLYLSPTVKRLKDKWIMWTVDYDVENQNSLSIYRGVSDDLVKWSDFSKVNCKGLPSINLPWHIGIEIIDEKILCILTSCEKIDGKKSKNWLARSKDLGFSFEVIKSFENKYKFENWFQYRASIVNTNQKDKVQIFYTAVDKKNICYIARKEELISDFKF